MNITIVGAGRVGSALGEGLVRVGHDVTFAVRNPAGGRNGPAGGRDHRSLARAVAGAGQGADAVILAVPFDAVADAVATLGPPEGCVLVDATNPMGRPIPGGHGSGAEHVAARAPGARVVKAFNVLGAEHMTDPVFPEGQRAVLPVAGDDDDARARVLGLAADVGFDAVDVGGLAAAHLLEEAARYWGLLAFAGNLGRGFALGALHRLEPAGR
jgi:predicted dinucleotide-binding enzyme